MAAAVLFWGFAAACAFILTATMLRRKHLLKGLLASAFQGFSALAAVRLLGLICPVSLSINWLTVGTAALLGSPGVALLLTVESVFA